jgi:hypothetical protein
MQLTIPVSLPAIVAACLGTTATVMANLLSFIMIGKINEQSPENQRISYVWWGTDARRRFKQLYPGNRLVFLLDSCVAVMILSFILLIRYWVFG